MSINHLEFLIEEESMEAALIHVVPKICGQQINFKIHSFQGKLDLLSNLENRLRGYAHWLPSDWGIVIVFDEDRQDCHNLKQRAVQAAQAAGLTVKGHTPVGQKANVMVRIAVEELEAWFFGDVDALCSAYPGVPLTLSSRAKYRNPDAILGGTWEQLAIILKKAGYHKHGFSKIDASFIIAERMEPLRNRSHSFCAFRDGLHDFVAEQ